MPERLEPNTIDTLTVVLSTLSEGLFDRLQDLISQTFDRSEYLLLGAEDLLKSGAEEAAGQIVKRMDQGIQRGELTTIVQMRTNLVLYTTLESAASEQIRQMRSVGERIGKKVGVLNFYACVVKEEMLGEENALAMDRCMEACRAEANRQQIPILLVNRGLGITLDLPIKATVRYLHVISHNSRLKAQLLARTEQMTSIAMLEYDDEDSFSLQDQIDQLQSELSTNPYSQQKLDESVLALVNEASARLEQRDPILFSQWPLRADAIGNLVTVLFRRAKLRRALDDVEQTFAQIYQKNVHERFCDGCFQTEETKKALLDLFEALPLAYVREQLRRDLDALAQKDTRPYEAYRPKFRICLGEKKLRAQLEAEYQQSLRGSRAYLKQVVLREMVRQAEFYHESGRIDQREKELKDRIQRLKAKARAVGNAQSAADFLQTQLTFLPIQGGVPFENLMNRDMILLISQRIDEHWDEYASLLPNSPQFEVYNYGVLEDQELQALQIMRFNEELYRRNRGLIFQIG